MKKKIAVLVGGYSQEAQISLKSGDTVIKHLDQQLYEAYKIELNREEWFCAVGEEKFAVDKNDFSVSISGSKIKFDAVFIIIHGTPGEDGKLQSYFDMLGIPYTGSSALASALTFNKYMCNCYLKQHGITVANSVLVRKHQKVNVKDIAQQLGFPMFVKPCDGGSSFGVTKVKQEQEIEKAIQQAMEHGSEVLIESFIAGTEVTCGIFKFGDEITLLPATEIVSKNEFFDFNAKYQGDSEEITPARISEEMMNKVQAITRKAFEVIGLDGLARIDFIIQYDEPVLIEVNTVPGMSAQSIIPQQAAVKNISLAELFGGMLANCFK